mgnify:CR=1 FL=1
MLPVKPLYLDNSISPTLLPESDLEMTLCPLCKSSDRSIIHTFSPFKVVKCKGCSLIYLNPRLKEAVMRRIYQKDEYFTKGGSTGYLDYSSQGDSLRITFKIPEHVVFYTERTLALLLQRAGFHGIRRLSYPHAFPLGLIASKLGIPIHWKLSKRPIWLPKTMIAMCARS